MKTKKELKRIYQEQKSMNRITNPILLKGIEEIEYLQSTGCGDLELTQRNIIDYAYDYQNEPERGSHE